MQNQKVGLAKYKKYKVDTNEFTVLKEIKTERQFSLFTVVNQKSGRVYVAQILKADEKEAKYKQAINQIIDTLIKCHHSTLAGFVGYSLKDFNGENNVTIFFDHIENSLDKILQEQNVDNTNIQIILIGIARAMKYLHDNKIIHFNLKPENVLLDEKLRPHVTDFSISPLFDKTINDDTNIYIAPEIIEGKTFNEKVDVYSFGILMFQMIFSKNFDISEFIQKVLSENEDNELKEDTDQNFILELIKQCCSKDPNNRPTFDELFKRLAFNTENSTYNIFDENKYFLNNVDIEKVDDYINSIDDQTIINEDEIIEKLNRLKESIKYLEDVIVPLKAQKDKLVDEISQLKPENSLLKCEIEKIIKENEQLKTENQKVKTFLSQKEKSDLQLDTDKNSENKINYPQVYKPISEDELKNMKINYFNSLPLHLKQIIISQIINTLPDFAENQFFIDVNNLLLFLLKYDQTKATRYFSLSAVNCNCFLANKDQKFAIFIHYELMEMLLNCDINEYSELLTHFSDAIIELKYPSESCTYFNSNMSSFFYNNTQKIKVGIFITGISKVDINFPCKSYVNYIKIDSTVKEIVDGEVQTGFWNNKTIGAFSDCQMLKRIEIPSSVTTIGRWAFLNCNLLENIEIPSSVTFINDNAFECCRSLKKIKLPSNLNYIGYRIFYGCSSLTEIEIPDSTFIGNEAFSSTHLSEFNFPQNITSINQSVLSYCTLLTQVKLPSSITSIKDDAFHGCTALKHVEIPSNVSSIGKHAFDNCSSISEIIIPDSVKFIDEYAFEGCTSLHKIEIPSSLIVISKYLFSKCSSLKTVLIPSSITKIEDGAFSECGSITNINIPSSVTAIGDKVFYKCSVLKEILLPSIKVVGSEVFSGCKAIKKIKIPSSVIMIGSSAFSDCFSLFDISLPESLSNIEKGAFSDCKSLAEINLPSSITSIEANTFMGCSSLIKIHFPPKLTKIGENSFNKCVALKNILTPESVNSIEGCAFSDCSSIAEFEIPKSITEINRCVFQNCSSLTKINIHPNVTSIHEYAFSGCSSLTQIKITSSVTSIGPSAFNSTNLIEFEIPSSVSIIESNLFSQCKSLKKIIIPSSITEIKDGAFYGCESLIEIEIPSTISNIYQYTFFGCTSLIKIIIPPSVTKIDYYSFSNCKSLKYVEISSPKIEFGSNAFQECKSLDTVKIPKSIPESVYENVFSQSVKIITY